MASEQTGEGGRWSAEYGETAESHLEDGTHQSDQTYGSQECRLERELRLVRYDNYLCLFLYTTINRY